MRHEPWLMSWRNEAITVKGREHRRLRQYSGLYDHTARLLERAIQATDNTRGQGDTLEAVERGY